MNVSITALNSLPIDLQMGILGWLDEKSLLAAGSSCQILKQRVEEFMAVYFKEKCSSESYVQNLNKKIEISRQCLLNILIVLAAKKAWKSDLKPGEHGSLRLLWPHTGALQPVDMALKGANAVFFFSEDGWRLKKPSFMLKKSSPLKVERAKDVRPFKRFSSIELGRIKASIQFGGRLCLLTQSHSSFFLVLEEPFNKIDLKIDNILSYSLTDGRIILGTKNGEILDYRFDVNGSVLLNKMEKYSTPISWVGALAGDKKAVLSKNTLFLSLPEGATMEYAMEAALGLPAILNNRIVFCQNNRNLIQLNPGSLLTFTLIKEAVLSWICLEEGSLLLTTENGILELISCHPLSLSCPLSRQELLLFACRQGGLIAVAFNSGELAVFKEKERILNKIYSTNFFKSKAPIHTLLFNKALELFITTREGGIFSIHPFPIEKLEAQKPKNIPSAQASKLDFGCYYDRDFPNWNLPM